MRRLEILGAVALVVWSVVVDVGLHPPLAVVATVAWVGALALRPFSPTAMALVSSAGLLGYGLVPGATSNTPFLASLIVSFAIGFSLVGRRLLLLSGLYLGAATVMDEQVVHAQSIGTRVLSLLLILAAPIAVGAVVRRTREQTAELRRVHAALDAERDARAAVAANVERTRIARDLHDVVAHSVSAMVVQAGAAEQRLAPGDPAREPLLAVRRTGKETLAELRRQLGVLRAAG